MAGGEVVQPGLHLNHALKGDSWISKGGSSGVGEGFSLMAMQSTLLGKKEQIELMLYWVAKGLGSAGLEGFMVASGNKQNKLKSAAASGLGFGVDPKKVVVSNGKRKRWMGRSGLPKSPKWAWRVKHHVDSISSIPVSVSTSNTSALILAPTSTELAQTTSQVASDSLGGVLESKKLPEVEEGEFVPWNDNREVENGGALSPMLSKVPIAKGLNPLESIPLFVKSIFPVEVFRKPEMECRVSTASNWVLKVEEL